MRAPILLPISLLAVLAGGACSQSLTPNMFGTGGAVTASGGFGGGGIPGTGGLGGGAAPVCADLAAKYQSALTAAETCQVGASGQCQQLIRGALSGCACPVYVTDTSALVAMASAWNEAGCATATLPCAADCPIATNNTCVSTDGGSVGFCSTGAGGLVAPEAILYPSSDNAGAYVLAVSNVPLSCQNTMPTQPCTPEGVAYTVWIQIPPADLVPGVYPLSSLVSAFYSETGPNIDLPTDCWGGVGPFSDGSLEIVAASSTELVFQLQDTYPVDFNVNGTLLTAQRCAGAMGSVSTL